MRMVKTDIGELSLCALGGLLAGGLLGLMLGKKQRRVSCMIKKLIKAAGGIAEIVLP